MHDVETVIQAARAHGEDSDPDHEVGDLQDALRVAWDVMTQLQRAQFMDDEQVKAVLAAGRAAPPRY
jgi:hypothetical protein